MTFLYYIPNVPTGTHSIEALKRAGVAHAFDAETPRVSVPVFNGPGGGKSGVVIGAKEHIDPKRIGYYPDAQTWAQIPGCDSWVGHYEIPARASLQFAQMLDGHLVTLLDGSQWVVPVARAVREDFSVYTPLPCSMALQDDGTWERTRIADRYAPLWNMALRWWDARLNPEEVIEQDDGTVIHKLDVNTLMQDAISVLGANYRLGAREVDMMHLLDDRTAANVMDAACDWPTIAEYLAKKKTSETDSTTPSDGCNTSLGETGDSTDTDRPLRISG